MAPKFRGNSEDWLDDQKPSHHNKSQGTRPKKVANARSVGLPEEEGNATVVEVFPNQCRVVQEGASFLCSYRRAEVVGKSKTGSRDRTPVAVGDRVRVSREQSQEGQTSQNGVIEGICVRKNSLSRPVPGKDSEKVHHVLAANIELLVVVASTQEPVFSLGIVDRFLVAAELESIPVFIVITKMDLHQGGQKPWSIYKDIGYDLLEVSVRQATPLDTLLSKIAGKMVVFCGHSGVGKTSLLRVLLGSEIGKVGKVNELTGKGRHTTTGAVLLEGPSQSKWVDTPGIRAFGLLNISPETLSLHFPEFQNLSCEQEECIHREEPNCAARNLPRYPSYRRILDSLISGEG